MGLFDDWKTRLLGRAAAETAKKAAREVSERISAAGEGFLSDAEKQLADAEAARKGRSALPNVDPDVEIPEMPADPTRRPPEPDDPGHARRAREAREASAQDELARMKAELKAKVDAHTRDRDED